jgi:hypothetical protein
MPAAETVAELLPTIESKSRSRTNMSQNTTTAAASQTVRTHPVVRTPKSIELTSPSTFVLTADLDAATVTPPLFQAEDPDTLVFTSTPDARVVVETPAAPRRPVRPPADRNADRRPIAILLTDEWIEETAKHRASV